MKTQKFNAYIKKLQYKKIESKKPSQFYPPVTYCIQATLLECKKGMAHSKTYVNNALLYITEEEYNDKTIGVGDKIEINENATWIPNLMSLKIYDEKKLKEMDESLLQKDTEMKTYANVTFDAYTLKCKIGEWKLVDKAAYIQCDTVKFYIDETQINGEAYCFFFKKDIFDKLVDHNMETLEMNCYLHKQKKWRKLIELQTAFDEASNKFFANLIVKGEVNA